MTAKWKIGELSNLVARALQATGYEGQASGRVREVPDLRTIRYYTTIGLLDRPAEMQGRTAYYGRRHLLQLVAVKRLQARGLSLVEVQRQLAGADERTLASWADLPSSFLEAMEPGTVGREADSAEEPDGEGSPRRQRGSRFWADAPDESAEPVVQEVARMAEAPQPAVILPIGERVSLMIEGIAPDRLDPETLAAIRPAAARLLDVLRAAGLVPSDQAPSAEANAQTKAGGLPNKKQEKER